jgi:SAM-dependent methyltransferase
MARVNAPRPPDTIESDYYAFMGFDSAHTRDVLTHYVPMFTGPVLELACGRGEFLDLLREAGVEGRGVDLDDGMVAAARERGHDVALGDALAFLDDAEPETYGGVFAAHFVEHLDPDAALRLVRGARRALKPGGRLVLVTPNAASLSVLGHDFWKDPTHVRFYDPMLLGFLCAQGGLTVEETGVNPRNDPGPPPHLHAPDPETHPSLTELIKEALVRPPGWRTRITTDGVDERLAHLLDVVSERLLVTEAALVQLQKAHESLLAELYPANEVYVVAHA